MGLLTELASVDPIPIRVVGTVMKSLPSVTSHHQGAQMPIAPLDLRNGNAMLCEYIFDKNDLLDFGSFGRCFWILTEVASAFRFVYI